MLVALMLATVLGSPFAVARVVCLDTDLDTRHWVEKYFALADVVMLGNVVSAETPGKPEPHSSMEGASLEDRYRRLAGQSEQAVTLKPVKVWKGSPSDALAVTNEALPPMHGFLLRQGETYLVFAYRQEEGGSYRISTVCGDTKRESDAADRIEVLNELVAMKQYREWPFPLGKIFPDQPLTCEFRDPALVERTIRDLSGWLTDPGYFDAAVLDGQPGYNMRIDVLVQSIESARYAFGDGRIDDYVAPEPAGNRRSQGSPLCLVLRVRVLSGLLRIYVYRLG